MARPSSNQTPSNAKKANQEEVCAKPSDARNESRRGAGGPL
jgi:hypothetical protein